MNLLYRAGFMDEMTGKAGRSVKIWKIQYRNCEDVKRG